MMLKRTKIASPSELKKELSLSAAALKSIESSRREIRAILDNKDKRLLVIVGPCSFHDPNACAEYAGRLHQLADEVSDKLFIVMRVYLEKPRTSLGWKGYINDPYLDDSFKMEEGAYRSREFMLKLCELGLPVASEILSPYAHFYFDDLLSWAAIGARTVESQPHRELAASLSMPIGFKNPISGSIQTAINAILFSMRKQTFLGVNEAGGMDIIQAHGNPYSHLVLRGSQNGPNYGNKDIMAAEQILEKHGLPKNIIVDCSHDNSSKNYKQQEVVLSDLIAQINAGTSSIKGVMIESFIEDGNQPVSGCASNFKYGCSITDQCLGWENTEAVIREAYQQLNI